MISFGLPAFWAPECRVQDIWTPGKREKRDFGLMESKKVWLVVTCEWAAFAIL